MRQPGSPRPAGLLPHLLVGLALVALIFAWRFCYGVIAFDDWTCGFVNCVKVKP